MLPVYEVIQNVPRARGTVVAYPDTNRDDLLVFDPAYKYIFLN